MSWQNSAMKVQQTVAMKIVQGVREDSFVLGVLHESIDSTNFRPVNPSSFYMELNEIVRISCKVSTKVVIWVPLFCVALSAN